jgi:hypothetical protein
LVSCHNRHLASQRGSSNTFFELVQSLYLLADYCSKVSTNRFLGSVG